MINTIINNKTYLNASWKISNPSVITNFPIKQKTPIGAKEIIIITSCINTVFNFSKDSLKLLVKWFVLFNASPNKILKNWTHNQDKETAIAVVERYKAIVLKVMFPRLCILVKDEIPETSEKKTKGTISNFNKLTKIELPRLNI